MTPKFILDVHFGKLAKYLRLFGFDSLYRNDYQDQEIIEIARAESRIIISRDADLLKNKGLAQDLELKSILIKQQMIEIIKRFNLINQISPFTRCLSCNALLEPIDKQKIEQQLPAKTSQYYSLFYQCQGCQKIYWRGSHYKRMQKFVDEIKKDSALD